MHDAQVSRTGRGGKPEAPNWIGEVPVAVIGEVTGSDGRVGIVVAAAQPRQRLGEGALPSRGGDNSLPGMVTATSYSGSLRRSVCRPRVGPLLDVVSSC